MVMLSFDRAYEFNNLNNYQEFRESSVGQLIYRDIQKVVDDPAIWKPFLKWSTLAHSWAVQAVCGGTLPYVVIEPKFDGTTSGCFRKTEPYNILLNRADAQNAKGEDNLSKQQKLLKEIEITILHELVHWGRHWSGTPSSKYSKVKGKWIPAQSGADVGHMFEMEAYPDRPVILPA